MATQRFSRPIREREKYFSCLLSPFPLKMIYWEFCVINIVLLVLFCILDSSLGRLTSNSWNSFLMTSRMNRWENVGL